MNELFIRWPDLSARPALFHRMIGDTLIWAGAVFLAYFLAVLAPAQGNKQSSGDPASPTHIGPAKVRSSSKKQLKFLNSAVFRDISSLVITCLVALILLKILAQSGRAWISNNSVVYAGTVLRHGQVVLATMVAFWGASIAAHQLLRAPMWIFLLAPPIIAIIVYLIAAIMPLADVSGVFVPSSVVFATILPLQYIGFGSLAAIGGYWHSVKIHRIRHHQHVS